MLRPRVGVLRGVSGRAPDVSGRAEEDCLSSGSGGAARAFGRPATPAVSATAVVSAAAEGLRRGETSLPSRAPACLS